MYRYLTAQTFLKSLPAVNRAHPAFRTGSSVSFTGGDFTISSDGRSAPVLINSKEWPGVTRAFKDLRSDIGKVKGFAPELFTEKIQGSGQIIIAGTSPAEDHSQDRRPENRLSWTQGELQL